MQEVLDQLGKAAKLLCEVEEQDPIDEYTLNVLNKIFLAHAYIKFAKAKLHILITEEEKTCEDS